MTVDILALGAHPDDVELTCAGSLIKFVRMGYKVGIVDLTEGELGTRGTRQIRAKEAAAAAKIIGATRENLRLPDGNIEVNQRNIMKVIQVYRKYRPKFILIPHFSERHPDHVHAHHLCREAWFYAGLRKIRTTLGGKSQEPWRPENYFHFMQWFEFAPSFIVDITEVHDVRMEAIKAYSSQFYDPRSKEPQTVLSQATFLDFIETRAKEYGTKIGVKYGEPFYSVEAIGVNSLFDLRFFKG
jgi:bacillithiol biosynthesis deacetylase BshB1